MAHWTNNTDGVFDIKKQAASTASLVVDLLLEADFIAQAKGDVAVAILAEQFLSFRNVLPAVSNPDDITKESRRLSQLMISQLIERGIVQEQNLEAALEIAEEEIRVQWILERV